MKHKIEVTQDDINNGIRNDCDRCPVALAISRALPACRVSVYPDEVEIVRQPGVISQHEPPSEVTTFVNRFDNPSNIAVISPFSFEMDFGEV
jgi:hypothetical protein